jgi:hypothetical protein
VEQRGEEKTGEESREEQRRGVERWMEKRSRRGGRHKTEALFCSNMQPPACRSVAARGACEGRALEYARNVRDGGSVVNIFTVVVQREGEEGTPACVLECSSCVETSPRGRAPPRARCAGRGEMRGACWAWERRYSRSGGGGGTGHITGQRRLRRRRLRLRLRRRRASGRERRECVRACACAPPCVRARYLPLRAPMCAA